MQGLCKRKGLRSAYFNKRLSEVKKSRQRPSYTHGKSAS